MMSVYPQGPRPTSPIRGGHYSHPPHHVQSARVQPQSFNDRNNQYYSQSNNNNTNDHHLHQSFHNSSSSHSSRPRQLFSDQESSAQRTNTWNRTEENREYSLQKNSQSQKNSSVISRPTSQRQDPIQDSQSQGVQSSVEKKREIRMFVSKEEQYSICYPNWWSRAEPQPGQVLFVSPRSEPNEFCHNISVVVENLGEESMYNNFTLYTNVILQSLMDDPQIVVLESNSTLLSGIQAHQVSYSARHLNTTLIFRQIWLLHEGKSYIVTFTCEASKYTNTIVNMAQEIMATLRLLSVPLIPSFSISDTM
eukprot:TRINITY_DN501_c0_g1_i10.p1 TRINITY_DN501_c0_g1~~TRINITY_DN501_c0_g1_i10.p1  ORF type:complete len:307 (-),score=108.58 TRINITY_DN501_c0_g1_i10:190-1110(-)